MLLLLSLFCVSSANSSLDSNEMVKMMLLSPGLLGRNELQAEQMRQIVPFMMLDEDASRAKSLMVLMTTQPHINPVQLLPFLLLDDEIDLANLFVTAAMMQSNCQSTNTQFNQLLPLMLIDNVDAIDANMKTMLLMQTLSEGNTGLDLDLMLPYLLMENESETDNLLLMVMMNAITGGMDTAHGFDQNFNVLLPLLFSSDSTEGIDRDMLVLLLALQAMSPGTAMNTNAMMPLLLMEEDKTNTELIMFMTMLNNQHC